MGKAILMSALVFFVHQRWRSCRIKFPLSSVAHVICIIAILWLNKHRWTVCSSFRMYWLITSRNGLIRYVEQSCRINCYCIRLLLYFAVGSFDCRDRRSCKRIVWWRFVQMKNDIVGDSVLTDLLFVEHWPPLRGSRGLSWWIWFQNWATDFLWDIWRPCWSARSIPAWLPHL